MSIIQPFSNQFYLNMFNVRTFAHKCDHTSYSHRAKVYRSLDDFDYFRTVCTLVQIKYISLNQYFEQRLYTLCACNTVIVKFSFVQRSVLAQFSTIGTIVKKRVCFPVYSFAVCVCVCSTFMTVWRAHSCDSYNFVYMSCIEQQYYNN